MARRFGGWRRIALQEGGSQIKPRTDADPAGAPTRIEAGCEIEGHLKLSGPLVVEGEFRGAITCSDDVTVRETGTVEAPISARNVIIRGAVVGDVEATREVVVHATARLHGSVVTPSLVIERGGFFQGTTKMYRPEAGMRRSDAATPAPSPDSSLGSPLPS